MEMTISRDRWQLHLKTRGQHYHEAARELEALHARHPEVGADTVALCLDGLAEILERVRVNRLTRHQHILLRMGELIAIAEGAASLSRRAALSTEGRLNPKANTRFSSEALASISRVFARGAALRVVTEGLRWAVGADGVMADIPAFAAATGLSAIQRAQTGLIDDMDYIADAVYGRAKKVVSK
jgi:hypothetical protein